MILNVNATRMELTRLKKEYRIAVSGHKLLKDKCDEMMRQFLIIARECRELRRELESAVGNVNKGFAMASAIMGEQEFKTALLMGGKEISLDVAEKNVMSVPIPVFSYEKTNNPPSCSEDFAAPELAQSIALLDGYKDKIIHLAELEGAVARLAAELEKTRRRVNSLEYVMIPNYQDTIKFIRMKIEENDRSNTTRLLKVKDMMIAENIEAKHNQR
ncbi:MAG: V-type ATP synthase subunit D [Clostridia bacterium]|nr:V-type ATP synthase subunit D [Clostridia bacterium]